MGQNHTLSPTVSCLPAPNLLLHTNFPFPFPLNPLNKRPDRRSLRRSQNLLHSHGLDSLLNPRSPVCNCAHMALPISRSSNYVINLCLLASSLFLLLLLRPTLLAAQQNSDSLPATRLESRSGGHILWYSEFLEDVAGCAGIQNYSGDPAAQCAYARTHDGCRSLGYIPYLQLFYCRCSGSPALGYAALILWLLLLFYLLGTTTADYFCPSLEGTSRVLKLSPSVAGVTLLSLGNGAPDLFSSIASFAGGGGGEANQVGLNSILGGAFFVSTVVVGLIGICVDRKGVSVSRPGFIRDVLFLLLSLACLLLITYLGEINLWGALCFLSLYAIYTAVVSATQVCGRRGVGPLDQLPAGAPPKWDEADAAWGAELAVPLLGFVGDEKAVSVESGIVVPAAGDQKKPRAWLVIIRRCWFVLELPLSLPRRLTIPVISEEQWSKPFGVLSAAISPLLLTFLSAPYIPQLPDPAVYSIGCSVGVALGAVVFLTTDASRPPRRWLFPWLAGGFVMSVIWTYLSAQELVSLLVSLGLISGISSAVLGLIVLAWGNSLGDLVANVSMAVKGGPRGTQVAISGCYAGPLFNVLVGLGLSLVLCTWAVYPSHFALPRDSYIYETMGFLWGGLLYAVVVLWRKGMRLDRYLGWGLLGIYLCFLCLRIARATGLLQPTN